MFFQPKTLGSGAGQFLAWAPVTAAGDTPVLPTLPGTRSGGGIAEKVEPVRYRMFM